MCARGRRHDRLERARVARPLGVARRGLERGDRGCAALEAARKRADRVGRGAQRVERRPADPLLLCMALEHRARLEMTCGASGVGAERTTFFKWLFVVVKVRATPHSVVPRRPSLQ